MDKDNSRKEKLKNGEQERKETKGNLIKEKETRCTVTSDQVTMFTLT